MKWIRFVSLALLCLVLLAFSVGCPKSEPQPQDTADTADTIATFSVPRYSRVCEESPIPQAPYRHLDFTWDYGTTQASTALDVPENVYSYYCDRPRIPSLECNYAPYATDKSDDMYVSSLATRLSEISQQNGFNTMEQKANWVSAFVQSTVDYA